MRDVVIVGGGLTGLSAAYELEKLNIPYTLIEVKRRPGGSIQTVHQDGFALDGAAFMFDSSILDDPLVHELNLFDDLTSINESVPEYIFKELTAFNHASGTEALIQGLAAKLTAPRLMRMAVSSIGDFDKGRYALCLENGVMLDAKSIILAVPARYAERMFYGYINDISARLMGFPYESIVRVSTGWKWEDEPPLQPESLSLAFQYRAALPERVPYGHTIIQLGIRAEPSQIEALLPDLFGAQPVTRYIHHWSEADPVFTENHAENIAQIRALLPPGVALVGSDYAAASGRPGVANLADRIDQGRQAARQMAAFLKGQS